MLDGQHVSSNVSDDDEDDLPAEGWLDSGWSVSVVEPDTQRPTIGDTEDLDLVGDTDSIQTSSRQLQRELAVPDGQRQASPTEATGDSRQQTSESARRIHRVSSS